MSLIQPDLFSPSFDPDILLQGDKDAKSSKEPVYGYDRLKSDLSRAGQIRNFFYILGGLFLAGGAAYCLKDLKVGLIACEGAAGIISLTFLVHMTAAQHMNYKHLKYSKHIRQGIPPPLPGPVYQGD